MNKSLQIIVLSKTKVQFSLLLFAMIVFNGVSQDFSDIIDTTNIWYVAKPLSNKPNHFELSIIFFDGDSVINGFQYQKIIQNSLSKKNSSKHYLGSIRMNQHGDIMYVPSYYNCEFLLYPKQINHGDTISIYTSYYGDYTNGNRTNLQQLIVCKEDSIFSVGEYHKSYSLHRICDTNATQEWIIGIGSLNGLLWNSIMVHCAKGLIVPIVIGGVQPALIAFKSRDKLNYFNPKYMHLRKEILNH